MKVSFIVLTHRSTWGQWPPEEHLLEKVSRSLDALDEDFESLDSNISNFISKTVMLEILEKTKTTHSIQIAIAVLSLPVTPRSRLGISRG